MTELRQNFRDGCSQQKFQICLIHCLVQLDAAFLVNAVAQDIAEEMTPDDDAVFLIGTVSTEAKATSRDAASSSWL